jgi:Tol biopolymer transport system component
MLTSANGGDTFALTKVAPAHRAGHAWPEFLPDGRHVLYTDYIVSLEYGIYVLDLDTRVSKRVVKAFSRASYSPGMGKDAEGFLLYAKDSLVAQPFDLKNLEVRGAAKPLADRVLQWGDLAHHADFTVSHEGTVIARTSSEERHRLVWIDRESGKITGEIGEPTYSSNPTLSTDGKTLAVTMHEDQPYRDRIWLIDTASGVRRPFTEGQVLDFAPIWFFDRVLFSTVRDRRRQLYGRLLDNGIEAKVDAPDDLYALDSVSRDESIVTFRKLSPATKSDVWAWRPRDPASTAFPVLTGPENEGNSRLSPDGRYLAYASDESGRFEVYIRTFPDATATWRVSVDGGADPKWNANGRELFFVGGDRQMMAASVFTSPSLRASSPKPLFDTHLEMVWMDTRNHYDVTPDGRRFVILRPESDRRTAPFAVIGNWQRHP